MQKISATLVLASSMLCSTGYGQSTDHDLADLEANGAITRVRGAVSAEKSVLFESSYLFREQKHIVEKRRLAQAAVKHIDPGMAVIWDDSTTAFQVTEKFTFH